MCLILIQKIVSYMSLKSDQFLSDNFLSKNNFHNQWHFSSKKIIIFSKCADFLQKSPLGEVSIDNLPFILITTSW